MYESATITAAYFENGEQTDDTVHYEFDGADSMAYSAEIVGNSVTITCWRGETLPLTVVAVYGELRVSTEIELEGI